MEEGRRWCGGVGRWRTDHTQTLLAEVVVDVGGLHGQVAGGVEGVALILRGLVGCLTHCQQIWEGGGSISTVSEAVYRLGL